MNARSKYRLIRRAIRRGTTPTVPGQGDLVNRVRELERQVDDLQHRREIKKELYGAVPGSLYEKHVIGRFIRYRINFLRKLRDEKQHTKNLLA